jgi:ribosomal protein S18 acetylase RimI-like enzyme
VTPAINTRGARKADASDIALLVNIAAHGGPAQGWGADEQAESDGEVVGMVYGYREPDVAPPLGDDLPPFFVPLYELEAEAAGDWYINMLGVYAPWRNKGIGSILLDVAEAKRDETSAHGLALITEDVNAAARRLYERRGFKVKTSRKMVQFPGGGPHGEDWLLMVKE